MRPTSPIGPPGSHHLRRAIVVVLDGLRPDAIERFDLSNMRRLVEAGASTLRAQTVCPSLTTAAMTSLLTGVSPVSHGITSDRIWIPRATSHLAPLAEVLMHHGFPSSAFMREVPSIVRGIAARVGRRLGFGALRLAGHAAADIQLVATSTLRTQRRGLILMHWPDADRAGHASGWMSDAYGDTCVLMDRVLGELMAMPGTLDDPGTMLVALADHGGGGAHPNDHESDHPADRTIPIVFAGHSIQPVDLGSASLLDVPATILGILGVDVPRSYEGRDLRECLSPTGPANAAVA